MFATRSFMASALLLITMLFMQGCSDAGDTGSASVPEAATSTVEEPQVVEESQVTEEEGEVIDPDELEPSGQVELKQYTVAYVGSGTVGGGTLTVDGEAHPFRISGLGIGGFGASSVDASGVVYNLPDVADFPGTYGNARLGLTAGDSGSGKLWLKSQTGVVIELKAEMRGLALAGGLDGIFIEWDEGEEGDTKVDEAMDGTREVVGDGIEAGADAVQKGVDNVKGWFKGDKNE